MAQPSEKVSQRTNLNCEQSRPRLPSTCYVKALSPKSIENPEGKDLQPYTTQSLQEERPQTLMETRC